MYTVKLRLSEHFVSVLVYMHALRSNLDYLSSQFFEHFCLLPATCSSDNRDYTIDDVPKGVGGTNGVEIGGQTSLKPTLEKRVDGKLTYNKKNSYC